MRTVVWGLMVVVCAAAGAASAAAQVTPTDSFRMWALEDSLWASTRAHKVQAFADFLAPNYRGVYADGVHDRMRELATFDEVYNESYQLNDFVGRPLGPDRFLVTYRATVEGKYRNFRLDGNYWCASLWERGPVKWQMVLHTETKVP